MAERPEAVPGHSGDAQSCANCGQALHGRFCSDCGQENRNPARIPAGQIVQEWLGDTFTFDSRFLRTLVPLILRPGFLTREYLAGRRARYVPPLRMFVFLSLVMFLVLTMVGAKFNWTFTSDDGEKTAASDHIRKPRGENAYEETPSGSERDKTSLTFNISDDSAEIGRRVLDRIPQVALLLVPVLALSLWVLHRRREPFYSPHLVFSLHLHSFVFLLLLVGSLVDLPFSAQRQPSKVLMTFVLPAYLYLAQRQVYGGGRLVNLLKTAGLLLAHVTAWVLLMMGLYWLVVVLA